MFSLASSGLAELIAHPKARSAPENLVYLANVYPRLSLCIHGAQILRSVEVKEDELRVEIR